MYRQRRKATTPQPRRAVKLAMRSTIAERLFDGLMSLDTAGTLPPRWGLEWPGDDVVFVTVEGVRYRVQVSETRPRPQLDPNPTFEMADVETA